MRWELPEALLAALHTRRRAAEQSDDVEVEHDAFLLDPGLGPAFYLTVTGRVLVDGRFWDGEPLREATDDEAIAALVVGAKKTGIAGLLDLVPPCPHDGCSCPTCGGARIAAPPGFEIEIVCVQCRGRGWVDRSR